MDELIDFLSRIKSGVVPPPADEAKTKAGVVLPILRRLGWDVEDLAQVEPEHSTSSGRVDYCLTAGKNRVFLEVKKTGVDVEGGEEQLLRYCFDEGAEVAVITNGEEWSLFLPSRTEVRWQDRKFRTIDIREQEVRETAELLDKFLARSRVESGKALVAAREAFEEMQTKQARGKAIQTVPQAWHDLVSGPDQTLVDLINEAVERLCDYRAPAEAISDFLTGLTAAPPLPPRIRKRPTGTPRTPPAGPGLKHERPKALSFRGKRIKVRNWWDVLVQLSGLLYSLHKDEFSRCLSLRGKGRSHRPLVTKGPPEHGMRSYRLVPGSPYFVLVHGAAQSGTMARSHRLLGVFGYEPSDLAIETD